MVSRNYSSLVVNEALGLNLTQLDMVTVSAEEDTGLVQTLSLWNSLVRGSSSGKQVFHPFLCATGNADLLTTQLLLPPS